jgi:hypothetical protein
MSGSGLNIPDPQSTNLRPYRIPEGHQYLVLLIRFSEIHWLFLKLVEKCLPPLLFLFATRYTPRPL